MAIKIIGKCSNCGAKVNINDGQEKAFCPYCGTEYIIDKGKQGFADKAFSYLNKAGERRQEELRRKEEAKERERIRKAKESKMVLIFAGVIMAIAILALISVGILGDKKGNENTASKADDTISEQATAEGAEETIPQKEPKAENNPNNSESIKEVTETSDKTTALASKSSYTVGGYQFTIVDSFQPQTLEDENVKLVYSTDAAMARISIYTVPDDETVSYEWLEDDSAYDDYISSAYQDSSINIGSKEWINTNIVKGRLVEFEVKKPFTGTGYFFMFPDFDENQWYIISLVESDELQESFKSEYLRTIDIIRKAPKEYEVSFSLKDARKAAHVAITNLCADDVFKSDGNTIDVNKLHSYSDKSGFYFSVTSLGEGRAVGENVWSLSGIGLQLSGSDMIVENASCDIAFDGENYIISRLRGKYYWPEFAESFGESSSTITYLENLADDEQYREKVLIVPEELLN